MERPVSGVRSVYRRGGGPVRACSVRTHAHSGIRPNGRIRILPQQCLSSSGWLAVLSRSSHGRWRDGNVGRLAARGREGRGAPAAPVRRTRTRLPILAAQFLRLRPACSLSGVGARCDRAAYKKVNIRLTNQKTLFATVSATLHAPLDAPLPNRADTTVRFVKIHRAPWSPRMTAEKPIGKRLRSPGATSTCVRFAIGSSCRRRTLQQAR